MLAPPRAHRVHDPIRILVWTLAFALFCFAALSGCGGTAGLFGIASTADLNDQAKALQEFARQEAQARQTATHAAIVSSVAPLDEVFPKLSESVAATLANAPYKPTPEIPELPEEGALPWWAEEATGIVATTVLAYFGVNAARDRKRRKRGEPVTPQEAEERKREERMYANLAAEDARRAALEKGA